MSEGITFSVVIPAYNAAATITACLDSVLAQRREALEIIVVDDASKDETISIISRHYDGLVQLIALPQNAGPSAARNAGMDAAKGTHVCFLDADDIWHTLKLAQMEEVINALPGAGLWFHRFTLIPFLKVDAGHIPAKKITYGRLLLGNLIAPSCAIVPNTSLRFDTHMRFTEDYDFFLRACWRRKIVFLNESLTVRSRPLMASGGLSSQRWQMRLGELRSYAKLTNLSAAFILLVPFLMVWSLLKYIRLSLRKYIT